MYNLKIRSSKTLSLYIASLYIGLVAVICWLVNIDWIYKCIIGSGLIGLGYYQIQRYGLKSTPSSFIELRRLDQTQWQLLANNKSSYQGELADDCFITVPLTIVRIKQPYRLCRSLVITPDSVDKESYRQLRVILSHDFSTESDDSLF